MNSFHYLILFLLILCFMLRWSNMRKDAQRKEMMARRKEAEEAAKAAAAQPTDEAAEIIPAEAVSVDGEPIPTEEPATEATTSEEKPTE